MAERFWFQRRQKATFDEIIPIESAPEEIEAGRLLEIISKGRAIARKNLIELGVVKNVSRSEQAILQRFVEFGAASLVEKTSLIALINSGYTVTKENFVRNSKAPISCIGEPTERPKRFLIEKIGNNCLQGEFVDIHPSLGSVNRNGRAEISTAVEIVKLSKAGYFVSGYVPRLDTPGN